MIVPWGQLLQRASLRVLAAGRLPNDKGRLGALAPVADQLHVTLPVLYSGPPRLRLYKQNRGPRGIVDAVLNDCGIFVAY